MKVIKEVRTRNWFLEISENLNKISFVEPSIEFREASYFFKKKVQQVISDRKKELFKLSEECITSLDKYRQTIFERGKEFAELNEDGKPNIVDNSYRISRSKLAEWSKVEEEIKKEYAVTLETADKMEKELQEWLSKKVALNIKKVDSISNLPMIADKQPEFEVNKEILNKNVAFDLIADALCSETIVSEEEDGKEV